GKGVISGSKNEERATDRRCKWSPDRFLIVVLCTLKSVKRRRHCVIKIPQGLQRSNSLNVQKPRVSTMFLDPLGPQRSQKRATIEPPQGGINAPRRHREIKGRRNCDPGDHRLRQSFPLATKPLGDLVGAQGIAHDKKGSI